jgi:TDG/mug DNA glycosylase family protein
VTARSAKSGFVVPDLLAPGLRLVFCGTAPSRVSKERQAYYANPGNRFWRSLHEARLTPRRFAPAEYPDLLALGIGLTDLNKHEWGNDDELTAAGFDVTGFKRKMHRHRPGAIAFTSKFTASLFFGCKTGDLVYGLQDETLDGIALHVLPSTSGQAVRYFDLAPWIALATAIELGVGREGSAARMGDGGSGRDAGGLRPSRATATAGLHRRTGDARRRIREASRFP